MHAAIVLTALVMRERLSVDVSLFAGGTIGQTPLGDPPCGGLTLSVNVARSRFGFRQGRKLGDTPWVLTEIEKQFGLESSTLHSSHMFSFVALHRGFEGEPLCLCTIPLSLRAFQSSNSYT